MDWRTEWQEHVMPVVRALYPALAALVIVAGILTVGVGFLAAMDWLTRSGGLVR